MGLVTRLATREDIDAALSEMETPLQRPDMPLCHASDLSVPKTFREAMKGDFVEHYHDAEEQMPHRMPVPRGKPVAATGFCDASFASNCVNRQSHSGHLLFANCAPVKWCSKQQQMVETSAFLAEFIAMKNCIEDVEHLRFKLRMFGVPLIDGHATHIFCDNEQ